MMNFALILMAMVGLTSHSAAVTDWVKIKIPGARCGSGADYSIFLKKHSAKKLMIEFMSGGACWNKRSCVTVPFTWIYPIIEKENFTVLSAEGMDINPFKDHTNVYFPYCTGDVFTGQRISNYNGTKIYHFGYKNVLLGIQYLQMNQIIDFKAVDDLIVWGPSAGGIAALTHGKNIESYFRPNIKKTMYVDSPGLHFGPRFWDKFDADAKGDFKYAFNRVFLDVDFSDGLVAKKLGPVLELYHDWRIGFLYGLRDFAMSRLFGDISMKDHESLIKGPWGLPSIAKNFPHVSVWLSDSSEHRFLPKKKTATMKSMDNIQAIDFVKEIYNY